MPTGIITYAIELTATNVHSVTRIAAVWQRTVTPQHDMEEAADFGTTCYAILSVNWDTNTATFTTMWAEAFANSWKFVGDHTHAAIFRSVELTEARAQ